MEKKPHNWQLVEMYEENFIFEDKCGEFQVSVDKMGRINPPYSIHFNQLRGDTVKISAKMGAYFSSAYDKNEAIKKAYEMMSLINKCTK